MFDDTYAEQIIERKREPFVIPAIIAAVILLFVCIWLSTLGDFGFIAPCAWILGVMIGWRYLHAEYEYIFVENELTVTKIYSQRVRKRMLKLPIGEIRSVDRVTQVPGAEAKNRQDPEVLDFTSGYGTGPVYGISCAWEGKSRTVLIEPNEKLLKAMWRAAPSKVHLNT